MTKKSKKILLLLIVALLFATTLICGKLNVFNETVETAVLCACYVAMGYDVIAKAVKSIFKLKVMDENFLMTVATVGALFIGEYAEAVVVMLLYQTGELFQGYAVDKSRKSIAELMNVRPDTATKIVDGEEIEVIADEIESGDLLLLKVGDKLAVDGVVEKGETFVDTSSITGESKPVKVTEGQKILSSSLNLSSVICVRATSNYDDSTVAKILDLVENAVEKKSPTENFISKFSRVYTPIVVCLAMLIGIIPPIFFGNWATWLKKAMTFLFVSCPCALVISVPLGFFGGIGACSRCGILVKGGNYLETLSAINVFAFDKTGTITKGNFVVTKVLPEDKQDEVLKLASIAESKSNHPIAKSIVSTYGKTTEDVTVTEESGKGVIATTNSHEILCGNEKLMRMHNVEFQPTSGDTVVFVALDGRFVGSITIEDQIKPDSVDALATLSKHHRTVMLTGDDYQTAKRIAERCRLNNFSAELLPDEKVKAVAEIQSQGNKVAFVGDGVNDTPVMATADLSVAMGAIGSDSAIEIADVVIMHDSLSGIVVAKSIANKTVSIVKQNVIFALAVKFSVLFLSATGILSNLIFAIFADVGVSIIAILNSLRNLRPPKKRSK